MSLSLAGSGQITGFDAALSGFGGLVAVKSAVKTDTFSASVAAGGATTVTGLSISHAAADAANTIYLIAQLSGAHSDLDQVAGRIAADGTGLAIGDAASNRTRIGSSNGGSLGDLPQTTILMATYSPASTSAVTYDVRVTPVRGGTTTVYVNRSKNDSDFVYVGRSASALFLFEVKV